MAEQRQTANCQRCGKPGEGSTIYQSLNPYVGIRVCEGCAVIMDQQYRNVSPNQRASA